MNKDDIKLAVIGLGYVGLPLAVEFAKKRKVLGFDINLERVKHLKSGIDHTLEVSEKDLKSVSHLTYTSNEADLSTCNFFIVTVPTPVDKYKRPDMGPLVMASQSIGQVLKKGDIVVYESTVYPGATEQECVPVLEKFSKLKFNIDFFVGYSPERINPGDKNKKLTTITKVTSGSNPQTADTVDELYLEIIEAGTFKASSIRIAEASKVIENTQRDVNIALMNELSMIFNKMNIDTQEVLAAAATKWNFLNFKPGLVGGHCIGVDPYYLTHIAQAIGYYPEIILSSRRVNDNMGTHVVSEFVKAMIKKKIQVYESKILIMGLTFKENCPDIRNTKVVDVISELKDYNCHIDVFDPWANSKEVQDEYGIKIIDNPAKNNYDSILVAVAHDHFKKLGADNIHAFGKTNHVLYDLKHIFTKNESDLRL